MRVTAMGIAVAALTAGLGAPIPVSTGPEPARGLTGGITAHAVGAGETLRGLAARYGVDEATIAADNGFSAGTPLTIGQTLRIDNRHLVPAAVTSGVVVINVPQRMLFYGDAVPVGMPVAVGKADWPTPIRAFTILRKEENPTWDVPPSIQDEARRAGRTLPKAIPPGPANPLGKFWLTLSIPGVGIHGTNVPSSIYRVTTHGCIRMGPEHIAWLFERVSVGTRGSVVYEPVLAGSVGGEVWVEVHRDAYGRQQRPVIATVRALLTAAGVTEGEVDWERVEAVIRARAGIARMVGARDISARERVFAH